MARQFVKPKKSSRIPATMDDLLMVDEEARVALCPDGTKLEIEITPGYVQELLEQEVFPFERATEEEFAAAWEKLTGEKYVRED